MAPDLISPEYVAINRRLHDERDDYGAKAFKDAPLVVSLARQNGLKVLLDYGCGKGTLKPAVLAANPELVVLEYDPAIPGKDTLPTTPVDAVVALDVMEHVEPERLDDVLQSMVALRPRCVFFLVATRPAMKSLPDGRNAHLIIQPTEWWQNRFAPYFRQAYLQERPPGSFIYVGETLTQPAPPQA